MIPAYHEVAFVQKVRGLITKVGVGPALKCSIVRKDSKMSSDVKKAIDQLNLSDEVKTILFQIHTEVKGSFDDRLDPALVLLKAAHKTWDEQKIKPGTPEFQSWWRGWMNEVFCYLNPDPWMDQPWTEEEKLALEEIGVEPEEKPSKKCWYCEESIAPDDEIMLMHSKCAEESMPEHPKQNADVIQSLRDCGFCTTLADLIR